MRKLLLFSLPFGIGTLLCQYILSGNFRILAAAAVLTVGVPVAHATGRRRPAATITIAGLAAGILWFAGYAALFLSPAEALAGTEGTVRMELLDYAEEAAGGIRCKVKIVDPALRGAAVYYGGDMLLKLEPGDRVRAECRFYSAANVAGEESAYYTASGIYARLYGKSETAITGGHTGALRYLPQRLAKRLRDTAAEIYSPRAAGFLTALLTGERDGLDIQSSSDLSEAGLMHLTAVSGLHCGFLITILGVMVFHRQRLMALLGYPVLLLYMTVTGCTPSVVRACVMAFFLLTAPLLNRETDPPTSLAGALLVILLANPFAIASVSLQLSFAATGGLLLLSPGIYAAFQTYRTRFRRVPRRVWNFCTEATSASLGVMAATAPLSAVYFGALSLVSPAANLLVLWMAKYLFAAALVVTALCAAFPGLAPLAAVPEYMAEYVLRVAGILAKVPGHSIRFTGPAAVLWLLLVYAMLLLCALLKDGNRKYMTAAIAAAVCLIAARGLPVSNTRGGELTAVAVDVGQGAATLLHSENYTALVDCGTLGTERGPGAAVAAAMDTYGWDRLDCVALTHYHEDHAGGLEELLAKVEVKALLLPQLSGGGQAELQRELLALAQRYGVPVTCVEERTKIEMGQAQLTVYPPVAVGDTNEEGLTFLCTAGYFDLLITGDMGSSTEREFIKKYALPDIEVLVAGHHGSKSSTSKELLETVTPEVGIISVGTNNRFGHPSPETLDRMTAAGMTLFRTDLHGNILIQVHQS